MKLKIKREQLFSSIKSLLPGKAEQAPDLSEVKAKGEGLAKLHEYQHQVILGLFRINIAGLLAFLLIVLSFTLFTFSDPYAPRWLGFMMLTVGSLILVGCYRTVKEFRFYRKNYENLMEQLRAKLRQYVKKPLSSRQEKSSTGSRVLSMLKPQEYNGWDAKSCRKCQKSIELLSAVCQHCGQEQEDLLLN